MNERAIVVWPEDVGAWLAAMGETPAPLLSGAAQSIASATEQYKPFAVVCRRDKM